MPSEIRMMPRFTALCAGSIFGAELIFADNFRYATIEPVSVTAPMNTPMKTSASWMPGYGTFSSYEEFHPTRTAARPTKLCSIAMSSGIPVISTRRARQMPMTAPIAMAAAIRAKPVSPLPLRSLASPRPSTPHVAAMIVTTRAMVMPMIPYRLPMRADSCLDRPASARMNSRAATM